MCMKDLVAALLYFLLYAAASFVAVYVIWHFISKYW